MGNEKSADIEQLERLRAKMVTAAEQYGLDHPLVMHYSRQIDSKHTHLLQSNQKHTVASMNCS